ncbi:MAG: DUF4190 domain-containing protein [Pyrinomonadaceae bacterium]
MKKCPTCEKTFDDAMRFCQVDGTPLVEAAPPVDPYKTMVARPGDIAAAIPPSEPKPPEPDPPAAVEEDVLQIPPTDVDPKKTMYASEDEIRSAMAEVDKPVMDIPAASEPEPPAFIEPNLPRQAPSEPGSSASKTTPPIPSPFSSPMEEVEVPQQDFKAPEPEPPSFVQPDAPAYSQPEPPAPAFDPFNEPAPGSNAPLAQADWTPTPAAQDQGWQNQPMQNQQYQPGSGLQPGGQNQTLAIVSLVLGISSILFCGGLTGPPALITGIMAKKKATNNPAEYGGAGLALGGIITGVLGTLLLLLVIAYFVFVFLIVGAGMLRY